MLQSQGRRHAHTEVVLPHFSSLGPIIAPQIDNLLQEMFDDLTVKHFAKREKLRKILEQFALALIRHDTAVQQKVGVYNRVSGELAKAARRAKISDSRYPHLKPEKLLAEWGKIIEDDYNARLKTACLKAEGELDAPFAPLYNELGSISATLHLLAEKHDRVVAENAALTAKVECLTNTVDVLNNSLISIKHGQDSYQRGFARIFNPNVMQSPHGQANLPPADVTSNAAPTTENVSTSAANVSMDTSSGDQLETAFNLEQAGDTISDPFGSIAPFNHDANQKSMSSKSDSNIMLVDLLIQLRDEGCICQQDISKSNIPNHICSSSNKKYVSRCLELVKYVGTLRQEVNEKIKIIGDKSLAIGSDGVRNAADVIVDACIEKILQFDPKEVRRATILGLGTRVRDYKHKIVLAKNITGRDALDRVELIEPDQLAKLDNQQSMLGFTIAKPVYRRRNTSTT